MDRLSLTPDFPFRSFHLLTRSIACYVCISLAPCTKPFGGTLEKTSGTSIRDPAAEDAAITGGGGGTEAVPIALRIAALSNRRYACVVCFLRSLVGREIVVRGCACFRLFTQSFEYPLGLNRWEQAKAAAVNEY